MEFLGIGLPELLVILVLIMIVVGPQRLPEMAAQLGRFMRVFRQMSSQLTKEFSEALKDLEHEYDEVRGEWKAVGQGLDESAKAVGDELKSAEGAGREALGEAKAAAEGPSKPVSSSS